MPEATGNSELRFLLRQLSGHRAALFGGIALMATASAVTLAMPWFAGRVVQALVQGQVPSGLLLAWLAVLAVQALIAFGNSVVMGTTSATIVAELGSRVYDHLQALPLGWHQDRKRGEILALATNDVWWISGFLTGTLAPLLPLLLTCSGALILLMRIQPWIGLLVAVAVPLLVLGLKIATRQLRPLANANLREQGIKFGIIEQNLASLPLIKAFTHEAQESRRFAAQSRTVRDLEVRELRISSGLEPVVRLLGSAAVLALLWIGSHWIAAGAITTADLVSMLLYGLLLTQPVSQLAGVYGQSQAARGAALRLMTLLNENPEFDAGNESLETVKGEIHFESVAFGYPGRSELFLSLDLAIRAGETVAITGINGAGKSTLAHLLTRFVEPDRGQITLDGVELRRLSLRFLRSQVGLVSQHVLLFNASVAHNIGYGQFGASREQIENAARAAHAHEFIARLPQGYDTMVGDEGVRLSGGQKQRIALARALLKDPPILILDEATAMFDPEGERGFIAECHDLLHSRTVLLITHRPASLALADRVLKLEGGKLTPAD